MSTVVQHAEGHPERADGCLIIRGEGDINKVKTLDLVEAGSAASMEKNAEAARRKQDKLKGRLTMCVKCQKKGVEGVAKVFKFGPEGKVCRQPASRPAPPRGPLRPRAGRCTDSRAARRRVSVGGRDCGLLRPLAALRPVECLHLCFAELRHPRPPPPTRTRRASRRLSRTILRSQAREATS